MIVHRISTQQFPIPKQQHVSAAYKPTFLQHGKFGKLFLGGHTKGRTSDTM